MRKRMRHQQQFPILNLAPRASISIPQFDEVNRPVVFRAPRHSLKFAQFRIDLHKRARPQQRIHAQILQPDIAVFSVANVETLYQSDRDIPPNLYHPRQQIRIIQIESAVELNRKRYRPLGIGIFNGHQMRVGQTRGKLPLRQPLQIHAEQRHQVRKLEAVNAAQAVQLENTRYRARILKLRKPRIRNREFRIGLQLGDFLAFLGHFAHSDPEPQTNIAQLLSRLADVRYHGPRWYPETARIANPGRTELGI